MASVERGQLLLTESFDDGQDGGIDEPDIGVAVTVTNLPYALVIGRSQLFDPERPGNNIVQERDEDAGVEPAVDPVIHFGKDGRGDHKGFGSLVDQVATGCMVLIAPVQGGVYRSGIQNQRHERGSDRSLPARRAVSVCPEAPIPKQRGRGR
jgi:hypothetical protein